VNRMINNYLTSTVLSLLFIICISLQLSAQKQITSNEITEISGGAEYNTFLQNQINSGHDLNYRFNGVIPQTPLNNIDAVTTYDGITFDEDAANSEYYHIPPDPIGAAGPSHLVSVVNTSIEWFTKAGTQENSQRLGKNKTTNGGSFFESLTPTTAAFDPKVIYDQYTDRFVVIALEYTTSPQTSRIFLAVSKTSNPNGGWWFSSINSLINISGNTWADYPGLAVNSDGVFITANMFDFSDTFKGARLWIVQKEDGTGGFYDGGTATVSVYDPPTEVSQTAFTMQPAHMFGTPPTGVLTYLTRYSGYTDGTDESLSIITVGGTIGSPTFSHTFVTLGDIDNTTTSDLPNAPQSGTTTKIDVNDRRLLSAVCRGGFLWATATIVPSSGADAGQTTAHWFKVTTPVSSSSLSDQGNIGGESIATDCYTFFASIAVNSSNDICIGFSATASTIYPGCYFTGRLSTDAAGTTIAPDAVRAGLDYYVRTFGGPNNRWGDYSGVSVDPSDDQTFYVFNEYAITRGTDLGDGELGRWGTAFGVVPVSALPVELTSFTGKVIGSEVHLDWTTETEINNYGFQVERLVFGSDSWQSIGFVEGHGNSNSPKLYSFTDSYPAGGSKFNYRLKQIDNDGQFEYSDVVEVEFFPTEYTLYQNYPNPFNPVTIIKYSLPKESSVTIKVFDILGNEVMTLLPKKQEAGTFKINFDGSGLVSGIYIYQMQTESSSNTKKMLLLR